MRCLSRLIFLTLLLLFPPPNIGLAAFIDETIDSSAEFENASAEPLSIPTLPEDAVPAFHLKYAQSNNPADNPEMILATNQPQDKGTFRWFWEERTTTESIYEHQARALHGTSANGNWFQRWFHRPAKQPQAPSVSLAELAPSLKQKPSVTLERKHSSSADDNWSQSTKQKLDSWHQSIKESSAKSWQALKDAWQHQ